MRANPKPINGVTSQIAEHAIIVVNPGTPDIADFFEMKRRVGRIFEPEPISFLCTLLDFLRQSRVSAAKSIGRRRVHRWGGLFRSRCLRPLASKGNRARPNRSLLRFDDPTAGSFARRTTPITVQSRRGSSEQWQLRFRQLNSRAECNLNVAVRSSCINGAALFVGARRCSFAVEALTPNRASTGPQMLRALAFISSGRGEISHNESLKFLVGWLKEGVNK